MNRSRLALLLIIFLSLLTLSHPPSAQAIGLGTEVSPTEWISEHVLPIYYRTHDREELCSGSVLSDRHLLTAAHCLIERPSGKQRDLSRFLVHIPITPSSPSLTIKIGIKKASLHSKAIRFAQAGDLAILELSSPLPARYAPVHLDQSLDPPKGEIILAGFGLTHPEQGHQRFLAKGSTYSSPIPQNDLDEFFAGTPPNFLLHMSSPHGNGICSGDSGGPAFRKIQGKWVQIGIAHGTTNPSAAPEDRCPNEESYATRIAPYYDWIQSTIKEARRDELRLAGGSPRTSP